mmetsp:Transcript_18790/g.36817  ORF Transcript_18790/g.36817 Transcript_18790/m.36817 type:complete len:304 (-) Transcript_18790:539-1450(-)
MVNISWNMVAVIVRLCSSPLLMRAIHSANHILQSTSRLSVSAVMQSFTRPTRQWQFRVTRFGLRTMLQAKKTLITPITLFTLKLGSSASVTVSCGSMPKVSIIFYTTAEPKPTMTGSGNVLALRSLVYAVLLYTCAMATPVTTSTRITVSVCPCPILWTVFASSHSVMARTIRSISLQMTPVSSRMRKSTRTNLTSYTSHRIAHSMRPGIAKVWMCVENSMSQTKSTKSQVTSGLWDIVMPLLALLHLQWLGLPMNTWSREVASTLRLFRWIYRTATRRMWVASSRRDLICKSEAEAMICDMP